MRVIVRTRAPAPRRAAAADRPRRAPATPRSPPTPAPAARTANSPTSNCATAAAPAPRTASAPRRTPGCATCPCTSWTRTGSGAPSSRWPARSPPGPRCSPSPSTRPGGGNPNGCGCGSSPCPAGSPAHARRVVLHLPAHAPWAGLAPRRPRPAARARLPRLSTTPPVPTTQEPDRTRGTGAPSDLGRTVTPTRHNALTTPASTGVDQASAVRRKIRASTPAVDRYVVEGSNPRRW